MSQRLGQELRRLRKEKGLTLEEAAFTAGITLQYMSLLEKGQRKSASFEVMTNISKLYGVPLDYFAQFIDDEQSQVHNLSETELEIWSAINNKVKDEIYYKKGRLTGRLASFIFS
ncbi:helix-turn-helix domain-containing protein [Cohnella ginsengisoli]|uniref:Helix-turn-helix domain-containing protein n=1 Tax=Cohnella ginsengisoli TaxID=425004 RepID=A0A9X4QK97_9BACL|nr:helix-turn-helix transcriptional regulator [Cohnella ginsengisoli]MDG0789439.1 helix-turn-helix domain-containing protein [Cohnella ginsengisoli]